MNRLIPISGGGTFSITALLINSASFTGGNLQEDTSNFVIDTSAGPTTLILPEGIGLQNINIKFYFYDFTGNAASNPITIQPASASDTINGLGSVQINTANGNAWITGVGALPAYASPQFAWICAFGGAASSSAQGSSIFTFDQTFTPPQILTVLNDNTQILPVIAAPAANQIIQPIAANLMIVAGGSQAYNGTKPTLALKPDAFHDPYGQLPYGILNGGGPGPALSFRMTAALIPSDNASGVGLTLPGYGLYLGSDGVNQGATQGDSSIRVYGTYFIKTLA